MKCDEFMTIDNGVNLQKFITIHQRCRLFLRSWCHMSSLLHSLFSIHLLLTLNLFLTYWSWTVDALFPRFPGAQFLLSTLLMVLHLILGVAKGNFSAFFFFSFGFCYTIYLLNRELGLLGFQLNYKFVSITLIW